MSILAANVQYIDTMFNQRVGDDYVYGGVYSPHDVSQGCDCSGLVGWVLEGYTKGPQHMSWAHNVSTESWYFDYNTNTPAAPGTVGPYGTIAIAHPNDMPADAALLIAIMHGGGGENSHTACYTGPGITPTPLAAPAGKIMESNGDAGSCTNGTGGTPPDSNIWTDWHYLPGPIVGELPPPPHVLFYPDVSNNNWTSADHLTGFLAQLHAEGFAGVVHKVSEGNWYRDAYWPQCRAWCEVNDLSWLGYHYVSTENAQTQANNFVANNGGGNVMLDFETGSGDITNFWAVVQAFNDANVNVPLAYIPHWYWQQIGSPDLSALPDNGIQLVSSNYPAGSGTAGDIYTAAGADNGPGWAPYGGCTPAAWQFTDKATIAGITVDCNAHHTPENDLDGFFTGQGS